MEENGTGCSIKKRRKTMMAMLVTSLLYFQSVQADTKRYIPKAYIKVAESMESQYVEFMLNKMKETVPRNHPDGPAMNYYRSLLTKEQALRMVRSSKSFGIKKMILDQIYPSRFRNKTTYQNHIRMKKRKFHGKRQHIKD